MIDIELLNSEACTIYGIDNKTWEHIQMILLPCLAGLIPHPKGFFRLACPYCDARMKDAQSYNPSFAFYRFNYWKCPSCDYGYVDITYLGA
jgi:hypothetical protein